MKSGQVMAMFGVDGIGVDAWFLESSIIVGVAVLAHLILRMLWKRLHAKAASSINQWDNIALDASERPLHILWFFIALWLLLENARRHADIELLGALDSFAAAGAIFLIFWFLIRLIKGVEGQLVEQERVKGSSDDIATIVAVAKLLRVTVWIVSVLLLLQNLGVSVSGILAFGGIGGIAVGFAAKDLLANFFGSLTIFLDRPFTVGDWIRSPDQNIEGTVEDVGWRLTRIRTFDQRPLYVPNSVFTHISVENPSRMLNRRIYETIGLRYQDADKVGTIIEQVKTMLREHPEIDLGRTLIVNFNGFADSSLDFFVYTFTQTTNWVRYHEIKQDVLLKILEVIHRNDADVAFPTRTLMVQGMDVGPEPGSQQHA
ncbi:MAG: MscS family membrane protein [Halieaceae bacterium]|jgi:MscS family membrane protein